ncbi:MAG: hypothetical protein QXV73_05300 [Candidatus Micrarchaeia archaeon]
MAHQGSWTIPGTNIRLPDFGITEKIADIFGQSRNTQGGSQLRQGTIFNVGNVPYTYSTTPVRISPTTTYKPDTGGGYYQTSTKKASTSGNTTTLPSSSPPPSNPPPQNLNDVIRGKNVGDIINIGGRNYRVVDPGKGIIEPNWDSTWADQIRAEEERRRIEMENRIRGQIESGYNEFIKRLDELAGLYPQWEQEDITRFETARQTGLQGLETAKESSLKKLGLAREQALQQEQQAKGDIMSQLRQLLKASQMKAGLMGAGWSSATQQVLPAVLGKQAAQAGAQVARGTMSNLNQIAQKEVDVRNTFDLAKNELEQDFNNKMDEIAQRYRQLKSWIETEKANASLKKAQALAALDENLMNNLINEANWYKQNYLQQQQALQQWALNRLAQLQDYKIQLGQMGNFSPEQLTYQALQGLGGLTGRESGGWGEDIFGSLVNTAKRKRELLGL